MDAQTLYTLEYTRGSSTDKNPSYKHSRHGAILTSTLCYSIDLSTESLPHPLVLSGGDMGRQQLINLQHHKQSLCLVMLCTTVCWMSLTATFTLLIIRETMLLPSANNSYVLKYAVALVVLFSAWCVTAATCIWRYNRYRLSVNSELANADWMTVGTPSTRTSGETAVWH
ncbi:hypothetical protein IWW43_000235 [Coemansia sp. RSA 1935]|nr:hypothetical protein GGH14_001490 [Coemansia sp. RSA 370]KAJ2410891.1 hypothetical protein J3F80_000247 [Coemansia sp. RSA 2526]KAJ2435192.1 hypothetical protein IWW41_001029 [Coemansia sp. RSA 2522]KAJ2537156.1 hypothetical protein IWW43_000235 [Coemansia sp. RSA 1935]